MGEPLFEGEDVADLTVAWRSDIGNHHSVNQDAGGAWTFTRTDGVRSALLIVADGVSAGAHSEEASRLVVSLLHEHMAPVLTAPGIALEECLAVLVDAIGDANRRIARRPHSHVASADSTTVAAAFAVGDQIAGAWVGDSRVYRVRDMSVAQLTTDHSWAEGVVSRGLMTAEQAAADPRAHVIMRWLGPPEDRDPGIETFQGRLGDRDVILCCTDGLYMYFAAPYGSEEEIAGPLGPHDDLQAGLDTLVGIALNRGGYDNITAAAMRVRGGEKRAQGLTDEVPIVAGDNA